MRRPDLTFERVIGRFAEMLTDPTTTVPELCQHLKLVSYVQDATKDGVKIVWLMGVADVWGKDHKEVVSVAASLVASMVGHTLNHTIFDLLTDNETALHVAQFLSANPACAELEDGYKKHAIRFLGSWWKAIVYSPRYDEDSRSFFLRYREWLKALTGAFLNLGCWEQFYHARSLSPIPRLYAVIRQNYNLDDAEQLPTKLSWPYWDELPVLGEEWDARVYFKEGREELKTLVSQDTETLLADKLAIKSLCGQLASKSQGGGDVNTLVNMLFLFQHLRGKLLK